MLISWFLPWWGLNITELGENAVIIHPWGLEMDLGEMAYVVKGADMPAWFAPLMWIYLGLSILALLFSLFVSSKRSISLGKFKLSIPKALQ
jgi:hypothetical protein